MPPQFALCMRRSASHLPGKLTLRRRLSAITLRPNSRLIPSRHCQSSDFDPHPPTPPHKGEGSTPSLPRYLRVHSPLRQRAIIEPPVEPVLIARYVLLHRDIDERLIERDARHVGKGELDEGLDVFVVALLVAFRRGAHRAVDEA